MIKLILKIIFGLIGAILLLIIGLTIFLYFTIKDDTDAPPYALYNSSVTMESELEEIMSDCLSGIDPAATEITFTLTEDNINRLIFASIVESVNNSYLPSETYVSDEVSYIKGIAVPDSIPFVAGQSANVKHAYMEIDDNGDMHYYITANASGFNTNINFLVSFTEDDTSYHLGIKSLSLGNLNLLGNIGKMLFKTFVPTGDSINNILAEQGMPFHYDAENMQISFSKQEFKDFLLEKLSSDEQFEDLTINLVITE